jgi:hypothetical protein
VGIGLSGLATGALPQTFIEDGIVCIYPQVTGKLTELWKITMFNGKIHCIYIIIYIHFMVIEHGQPEYPE